MIKTAGKKHCMVFASRAAMEQMESLLKKKGFTIHCADLDGEWFLIYSDPDAGSHAQAR